MTQREGDVIEITTLRDDKWLHDRHLLDGGQIHVDLAEMGYRGLGRVDTISDHVEMDSSPGCIVLSTFSRRASDVRSLQFEGLEEGIRGTSSHPFFSLDRRAWIASADLLVGERVRTLTGAAVVSSATSVPGIHRVYNLEVARTHTYLLADPGIWVHNSCVDEGGRLPRQFPNL